MPQPLLKVRPNAEIRMGAQDIPPDLAVYVTRTVSAWAYCDHLLAKMLTSFVRGEFEVVSAMFQALTGGEVKRAALMAAATKAVPDDVPLIQACLKAMKASRNRRNDFAHHILAIADDLPGKLVFIDPTCLLEPHVGFKQMVADGRFEPKAEKVGKSVRLTFPAIPGPDKSKMLVYSEAELSDSAKDAEACVTIIKLLAQAVAQPSPDGEARQQLLAAPPIAKAFEDFSR